MIKLTEKSLETFTAVKNAGGRMTVEDVAAACNRTPRSVNANINDLVKKELAVREKVAGEGEDAKEITYVVLTDAGMSFVPSADED